MHSNDTGLPLDTGIRGVLEVTGVRGSRQGRTTVPLELDHTHPLDQINVKGSIDGVDQSRTRKASLGGVVAEGVGVEVHGHSRLGTTITPAPARSRGHDVLQAKAAIVL